MRGPCLKSDDCESPDVCRAANQCQAETPGAPFTESERRVMADHMWRDIEARKRFESECGFGLQGKNGVAEYRSDYGELFNQWALRQIPAAIVAEAPAQAELPPNPFGPNNAALARIDGVIMDCGLTPAQQAGVLIMALVLAARRHLAIHNVDDRGRRMRLIKALVRDVDSRLRQFVKP